MGFEESGFKALGVQAGFGALHTGFSYRVGIGVYGLGFLCRTFTRQDKLTKMP